MMGWANVRVNRHTWCVSFVCLICFMLCAACSPLPVTKEGSLAPYRTAMRPQTQSDLDQLGPVPRYDISISVDPGRLTIAGFESVLYTNRQWEPVNELYFRLYANLPAYGGEMQVTGVKAGGREVEATYQAERTALRVPLPTPLAVNDSVRVDLDFSLRVERQQEGRVLMGESQGILSLPGFYPMLAMCQDGAWDLSIGPDFADAVFSETALYRVEVDVPADMVVVGTGSVTAEDTSEEGRRAIHYVSGPVRDFGLIMSRAYQKQSMAVQDIVVNSYHLPEDSQAGYSALWRAAAAIQVFSDAFSEYPYAKLDVVEAPLGKRGMEYPALVMIGSEVYRTEKKRLEPLVVHEVAHQWWYNLVGSDPVNHPAVDEGLAEYSLYFYYEEVHGIRRAKELVQTRWIEPYELIKDVELDAPIEQPATAFIRDNYETVVYSKSSVLYDDLRRYMGDDEFIEAIRHYLSSYKHRVAPAGAFLGIASGTTARSLDAYAAKWRESTSSGGNQEP
jgi:hypothetical protein